MSYHFPRPDSCHLCDCPGPNRDPRLLPSLCLSSEVLSLYRPTAFGWT